MPHTLLTQLTANVPSGAGSTVQFHEALIERRTVHVRDALEIELSGGRCICVGKLREDDSLLVIIERPTNDGRKSRLEFGLSHEAAAALTKCLMAQLSLLRGLAARDAFDEDAHNRANV